MDAVSKGAILAAGAALGGWAYLRQRRAPLADAEFALWPELGAGKYQVVDLPLCSVLLADDAQYSCWLVLVPRVSGARDITDLSPARQRRLWEEVAAACRAVVALHAPYKLNVATIGNVVEQLHVHVTGRMQSDPAWPGPCYGAVAPVPLGHAAAQEAVAALKAALAREMRR